MLEMASFTSLFAQASGQYQQSDLMMIAFLPLLVAVGIFVIGIKLQHSGKPAWIKWLAMIPLAVGLILGIAPVQNFFGDPLYKDFYGGGGMKITILFACCVALPILGAVGLFLWNMWLNKHKFEDL